MLVEISVLLFKSCVLDPLLHVLSGQPVLACGKPYRPIGHSAKIKIEKEEKLSIVVFLDNNLHIKC